MTFKRRNLLILAITLSILGFPKTFAATPILINNSLEIQEQIFIDKSSIKTLPSANEGTNGWYTPTSCTAIGIGECKHGLDYEANLLLPYCGQTLRQWCIKSIEYSSTDQQMENLNFSQLVNIDGTQPLPAYSLPRGSSVGIWQATNGNSYYIPASIKGHLWSSMGEKEFVFTDLQMSIEPIKITNQATNPGSRNTSKAGIKNLCFYINESQCGIPQELLGSETFKVSLLLGKNMSGAMSGRIANPIVNTIKFSPAQSILEVTANPILVPIFSASIPGLPINQEQAITPAEGIYYLDAWANIANNKSSSEKYFWNFIASDRSSVKDSVENSCFNKVNSGFQSLMTTNATAYQEFPDMNSYGEIKPIIGAMHLTSDNKVFQGQVFFTIRSDVAKCYLGLSSAPVSAVVQVTNDSGDVRVATSVLQSKNDWMTLKVYGITFSTPDIKIKFYSNKKAICKSTKLVKIKKKIDSVCPKGFTAVPK
jgi:hypothetical protein